MFIFLQTPIVCLNTVTCSPQYMVSALAIPSLLCFCLTLLFIDVLWYHLHCYFLVQLLFLYFGHMCTVAISSYITWITVILSLTHIVVIDFNNCCFGLTSIVVLWLSLTTTFDLTCSLIAVLCSYLNCCDLVLPIMLHFSLTYILMCYDFIITAMPDLAPIAVS